MKSTEKYKEILRKARRLYKQEKSFPEVYRHLIKIADPDIAIRALEELKASNIQKEKVFQKIG